MTMAELAKTLKGFQTIVSFTVLMGALIAAGVLAWHQMEEKPTREEMDLRFDHSDEERTMLKDALALHTEQFKLLDSRMDRFDKVQAFQLEQSAWQGEVLQHIAGKRGPKPPERLRQLQRELMRGQ